MGPQWVSRLHAAEQNDGILPAYHHSFGGIAVPGRTSAFVRLGHAHLARFRVIKKEKRKYKFLNKTLLLGPLLALIVTE